MKSITQELENCNELSQSLKSFNKSFGLYDLLRKYGAVKVKGIFIGKIFDFLMALVFTGKNLYWTVQKGEAEFSDDTVHRFLKNTKIHWEKILLFLSVSVIARLRPLTNADRLTAIVVDDSLFSRNRSKKVELLSKVFDHVTHKFFMGFRMLTLGFTDGVTFIPFAQQLMASADTNNPSAITDKRTLAAKRRENAVKTVPQRLYELLKTAKTMKIPANHVLFDSWFSSPTSLLTIKNIGYYCVAMLKKNKTKYLHDGKKLTISQIYNSLKKRPGKSKYLASAMITVIHAETEQTIQAKIVFVRDRNNRKNWCAIISTDILLTEEEIIRLYGKRWDIEVFFKMCKSYLRLAKEFEGRSYDMMTAHTTIVFIRYICLAWKRRENEDPRCFGELFFLISDEVKDISFAKTLELLIETLRDALFLNETQVICLIDSFFAKLPAVYKNSFLGMCES